MGKRFFFIVLAFSVLCIPILVFNVGSDPPPGESPEPYLYFYPPGNSFGVGVTKTVNWSFFRDMFQSHFYKDCNYKRFVNSDWADGDSYVSVDKTWNDTGNFWKIDIMLDVPVVLYKVNISFGCDLSVLDYVERSGHEIWLNYSIPNSEEVYRVFFNFSDIASISGLTISKHFESGVWWIGIHRTIVPAGFYNFDPVFGEQSTGTHNTDIITDTGSGGHRVVGDFFMTPVDCTVNNLTFRSGATWAVDVEIQMAIYNFTDNSSSYAGNVVAWTETRNIPSGSINKWLTFEFNGTNPDLNGGERYYYFVIGRECYDADCQMRLNSNVGNRFFRKLIVSCPYVNISNNPLTGEAPVASYDACIYINYTAGDAPYSNTCPTSNNPVPTNSSTGISVNTDFNVTIVDADGNNTWGNFSCRENADTSSWANQANGSRSFDLTNPLSYNTQYKIWCNYSDNYGCEVRDWFLFTTEVLTAPEIVIDYAGNLGDIGGPYWIPPTEDERCIYDGYYTNHSKQQENFIFVRVNISEPESDLTAVGVRIDDDGDLSWYAMANISGTWKFNSSGNHTFGANSNVTIAITANSSDGNNISFWNKTGLNDIITRRYVHLNCTTDNIEYVPFYVENTTYNTWDRTTFNDSYDRLERDQGPDGSLYDTGMLEFNIPDDTVDNISCTSYIGLWWNGTNCSQDMDLDDIYVHLWWNNTNGLINSGGLGWNNRRMDNKDSPARSRDLTYADNRSVMDWDGYEFYLETNKWTFSYIGEKDDFTDNSMYQFLLTFDDTGSYSKIINNRSFTSFIIFNIPTNETLHTYDSDEDGVNDYYELFELYSNPFLADTDNDGINDYWENESGSDPNNYTDTYTVWVNTCPSSNNPVPANSSTGISVSSDFNVTIVDVDGNNTWGNFSCRENADTSSWANQANGSRSFDLTNPLSYNTQYKIWCNYSDDYGCDVRDWFLFTTVADTIVFNFISQDPSNIRINNTGYVDIIYNLTTGGTGLNRSSLLLAHVLNNTRNLHLNNTYTLYAENWVPNKKCAINRNYPYWFEDEFSFLTGDDTIGDIGEWAVHNVSLYEPITVNSQGSNWLNFTHHVAILENLFGNIFLVNHEAMTIEDKTGQTFDVYKDHAVKVFFNMTDTQWFSDSEYNNTYYTLHIYAEPDSPTEDLLIYLANSSYVSGDPLTSEYCELIGTVATDQSYDYTVLNSSYYDISFSTDEDGFVGSLNMTNNFSFIFASNSKDSVEKWVVYYADDNITIISEYHDFLNSSCVETCADKGKTWVAQDGTVDTFLTYGHLGGIDRIMYKVYCQMNGTATGDGQWSSVQIDVLDEVNLQPNTPNVITPNGSFPTENYTIGDIVNISYSWLGDPNLDTCWLNITVHNTTHDVVYYLQNRSITSAEYALNSTWWYDWDTTGVSIGGPYHVNVTATDALGLFRDGEQQGFFWLNTSAVIFSNPNPANNSIGNDINLTWNITMEDPYGSTFNWTIECSNGNSSSGNDDANGSKTLSIAWLDYLTVYTVWVNATNENMTTNETFFFTTISITHISITSAYPANGSFNAPFQPYIMVTVNHSIGETMNLSWYHGPEGAEDTFLGNDTNIVNSTQSELFLAAINRSTWFYWRVMAEDGEGLWLNETFSFRTEGYAGAGGQIIHPGANVLGFLGIFGIIGIIVFLLLKKKKKEDDYEEY